MKKAQKEAPLFAAVKTYKENKPAYFCIPGHRGARGIDPQWVQDAGEGIFGYDVTEAHGLDDLHAPSGAIKEAQELAADLYGADQSWFLVNGTTCGNEAMLLACIRPGDKVLVPRNAHKSILMGLILSGGVPVWMMPEYIPGLQLWGGITPETVEAQLSREPDIRAVVLVSPNYYGMVSDVAAIAALCHARGIPLLVDEAHGGHLYFTPQLPMGALNQGADLCVQSWHKVTGSLTQSSVLHMRSRLVDPGRVEAALKLVQSTSPSYLLMVSLDLARRQLFLEGKARMEELVQRAREIRKALGQIEGLACPGRELVGQFGIFALDESRITLDVTDLSVTGQEFSDVLFARYGVDLELAEERTALAIVTAANTEADGKRLVQGAEGLAKLYVQDREKGIAKEQTFSLPAIPERVLTPREAWFAPRERIPWQEAIGRVTAEAIIPYPPGIPLVYPGEVITEAVWQQAEELRRRGGHFHGVEDLSLSFISAVCYNTEKTSPQEV